MASVHFMSSKDDWETPPDLLASILRALERKKFDLDVCASRANIPAKRYLGLREDGLSCEWHGLCWMNPPYGRKIGRWMDRAAVQSATTICLVPARTDTAWWHRNVPLATLVVFLPGRLHFGGSKSGAPFPSALVVFGDLALWQKKRLAALGWAVETSR